MMTPVYPLRGKTVVKSSFVIPSWDIANFTDCNPLLLSLAVTEISLWAPIYDWGWSITASGDSPSKKIKKQRPVDKSIIKRRMRYIVDLDLPELLRNLLMVT